MITIGYKNWSFNQNEKGTWFATNANYEMENELIAEVDVVDIVKDDKAIMHKHFPMHGFHN